MQRRMARTPADLSLSTSLLPSMGARYRQICRSLMVCSAERYKSGVIFYSLGNLVFDQFQRVETQHGALGQVVFSGTTLAHAEVIPVDIVRTVPHATAVMLPVVSAASGGATGGR